MQREYRQSDPDDPQSHVVAYRFEHGGKFFEVGFSYLGYRRLIEARMVNYTQISFGVMALAMFLMNWLYQFNLLRPLRNLLEGIKRVGEGDFDSTVHVSHEDEIGLVARFFNAMVGSIGEARKKLLAEIECRLNAEERLKEANETLEVKVRMRTSELTHANESLSLAKNRAEAANRAKNTFLANMSHLFPA